MRKFNALETMPRHVQITLDSWTTGEGDEIFLSPTLVSEQEVDEHIDYLIKELNKAGAIAKKMLKRE
ncbi:hypothetical protein IH992_34720 [Candidatus Poribacteria bacterium]|nr:hypothetical protein [Candidatus Poribacteria bacterium]